VLRVMVKYISVVGSC